jgi:hypothetical protein
MPRSRRTLEMSRTRKERIMSDAGERIEDLKPTADVVEQERPDVDEPDDPERTAGPVGSSGVTEADAADVADQREEVPLDDEDGRE